MYQLGGPDLTPYLAVVVTIKGSRGRPDGRIEPPVPAPGQAYTDLYNHGVMSLIWRELNSGLHPLNPTDTQTRRVEIGVLKLNFIRAISWAAFAQWVVGVGRG